MSRVGHSADCAIPDCVDCALGLFDAFTVHVAGIGTWRLLEMSRTIDGLFVASAQRGDGRIVRSIPHDLPAFAVCSLASQIAGAEAHACLDYTQRRLR